MVSEVRAGGVNVSQLFADQMLRAERQKALLVAAFLGICAVVSASEFWLSAPTFRAMGDSTGIRYWVSVIMTLGAGYELVLARVLSRVREGGSRAPLWLGYLNVLIETSVVTGVLAIATVFAGPAGALSAPPVGGYALVAILTALRLDSRLCLFAGALAAIQYGGLALFHWPALQQAKDGVLFASVNLYAARSAGLALIGGASAFVAHEIRARARAAIEQMEQRRRVTEVFGRYLDDTVVDTLLRAPEGLALGGQSRTVTIMMTDLRGFTSLAERLPPEDVIRMLNHFLGAMTEIVRRHRGTIDEFIGDAILGIFGAPLQARDDATRAVACALEMQNAMSDVNQWNLEHGLPELEMGIGIHTGSVIVGNIGSEQRSKYGVVGSDVNLTSRIESYTLGGQILVSGATREAVGPTLVTDEGRAVRPKGVRTEIWIFEVRALGGEYGLEANTLLPPLLDLPSEAGVTIRLIDGKDIGDASWDGAFVRLSEREAEIRCSRSFRPLDNLRLEAIRRAAGPVAGEAFVKVVGQGDSPGTFRVRFTSRDESLVASMNSWLGEA